MERADELFPEEYEYYRSEPESISEVQNKNEAINLPPAELEADGRRKRLPDCILIGERKTGTTAMLHFLSTHPKIKVARKEVHFFDTHKNYRNGLEWYRNKMVPSFDDEITFEKSPRYFRTPFTPLRVYRMNPDIKLMLQVIDPIKRAISDFHFSMEADWNGGFEKVPNKTFEEYVINPETGEVDDEFAPLQRSFYDVNLENWLRYFDIHKNFHIVDGTRFVTHPVQELNNIEHFLGLKPYFQENMFTYYSNKGFYCLKATGCLSFGGHGHPPVEEKVIKKLQDFFEPHNKRFYTLVGKDFGW